MSILRSKPEVMTFTLMKEISLKERLTSGETVVNKFQTYAVAEHAIQPTRFFDDDDLEVQQEVQTIELSNELVAYRIVSFKGNLVYCWREGMPENGVIAFPLNDVFGELFWVGDLELAKICFVVCPASGAVEWATSSMLERWDKEGVLTSSKHCQYVGVLSKNLPIHKLCRVLSTDGEEEWVARCPKNQDHVHDDDLSDLRIWYRHDNPNKSSTGKVEGTLLMHNQELWIRKEDLVSHVSYDESYLLGLRILLGANFGHDFRKLSAPSVTDAEKMFELHQDASLKKALAQKVHFGEQIAKELEKIPAFENHTRNMSSFECVPVSLSSYLSHPRAAHHHPLFLNYVQKFGFIMSAVYESVQELSANNHPVSLEAIGCQHLNFVVSDNKMKIVSTIFTGNTGQTKTRSFKWENVSRWLPFAFETLQHTVPEVLASLKSHPSYYHRTRMYEVVEALSLTTIYCVEIDGYLWPSPCMQRSIGQASLDDDIPF